MTPLIVDKISKSFKNFKVLEDVSFEVKEGEIFGLIGPNGAGKSTLIKIITTLLKPDKGKVLIYGLTERNKVSQYIGVVFQENLLDNMFSVYENLLIHFLLYGFSKNQFDQLAGPLIRQFNLENYLHLKVNKLSGGTKRKVEIVRALIHRPSILILDEPTLGLDINSRQELWELIKKLNKDGLTVILTSHYLEEIKICHRILVLDKGRIHFLGPTHQFISQLL